MTAGRIAAAAAALAWLAACSRGAPVATCPVAKSAPAVPVRPEPAPVDDVAPPEGPRAEAVARSPDEPPTDVGAIPDDAIIAPSGLAWRVIKAGDGKRTPASWDEVVVHYSGWTTDGALFDSSRRRGRPARFPLRKVIPGWTEGLGLMVAGERRLFWIPAELAYEGKPGPQGMLVFDVELLSIEPGPRPLPAPADLTNPPADATTTDSGLTFKILTPGTGDRPRSFDKVEVHYTGWTLDGKMFDSSRTRDQPATFPLDRVIAGWTEGLQQLRPGATARLWIPAELAYENRPGRPQGTLVFDVELLGVERMPEPPPTPKDVARPPRRARRTASGLRHRRLRKGTGRDKPGPTSRVKVHYSGWTTDGKLFDSSVVRGDPATFPLDGVIEGWTEGVQLMVVGEKRRFWIPEELAYKGRSGRPSGMLVFDVELLEIVAAGDETDGSDAAEAVPDGGP